MTDLRGLRRLESQFFRAPSAHNTQPWLLDYGLDRVELRFDPARQLAAGDPTRRDLLLSLGAFVEAVLIAAAADGIPVDFEPDVVLDEARIGAFALSRALYATDFTPDDLARRRTSRLAYVAGRIASDELAAARATLAPEARLHELPAPELLDVYLAADRHLYDTAPVVEELRSWLRLDRRDPRYECDGLSYECLALSPLQARALALLLRPRVYAAARRARLHRALTAATKDLLAVEGSVLVLEGRDEPARQLLAHGRSLLRVWLALSRRGLYVHPLSQILDWEPTERELADRLEAGSAGRPLAVFRVGRSAPPARSHRLR